MEREWQQCTEYPGEVTIQENLKFSKTLPFLCKRILIEVFQSYNNSHLDSNALTNNGLYIWGKKSETINILKRK